MIHTLDFLVCGGENTNSHGLYLSAHQTLALNNDVLHFNEHIGVAILHESFAYSSVDAVLITTLAYSLIGNVAVGDFLGRNLQGCRCTRLDRGANLLRVCSLLGGGARREGQGGCGQDKN